MLFLIIIILIIFGLFYFHPIKKYNNLINSYLYFYLRLNLGQHVTSTSNALKAYREFIKEGRLNSPEDTNDIFNELYYYFKDKYGFRVYFIKKKVIPNNFQYKLTLENQTNYQTYYWTWNKIIEFNPERERKLMTKKLKNEIKVRDCFTCRICGKFMPDDLPGEIHIDHIIPVSKGGKSEPRNLQVLCASCNLKKSNKIHLGGE